MEKLKQQLDELVSQLLDKDVFLNRLDQLFSIYPFNENEFSPYEVKPTELLRAIRDAYQRQQSGEIILPAQHHS